MAVQQLKTKAKADKPNLADLLKQTQKDTKEKSKSSVTILETPPEIKAHVDALIKAKKAVKIAEAEKEAEQEPIKDWVGTIQDADGFAGKFKASYKIQGSEDTVTYVSQNSYSINIEDKEQIIEILGEEGFAELIDETNKLIVKASVVENPDHLLEVVGAENFVEFFESETKLVVKEDFNSRVYRYVTPEKLQLLKTFVKRKEASVR